MPRAPRPVPPLLMIILPAIDLLDGRVVRLTQGRRDRVTVYSTDPVAIASRWVDAGATWLHVVDLNGAFDGTYMNLPLARQVIAACGVRVELSGGIRTEDALEQAMAAGAARVVLGTKACEDPGFVEAAVRRYGEKIAVAIDARGGEAVARGWASGAGIAAVDLARQMKAIQVRTLICTDVNRDGMLAGPNEGLIASVLALGGLEIIASGGIASLEDLKQLKALGGRGVIGAIIGKALYEGTIDLREAIHLVDNKRQATGDK